MALALGLALIPFSPPLHRQLSRLLDAMPLDEFFATTRQFAATTCLVMIPLIIVTLDQRAKRLIAYLIVALAMAGLVNEVIKQTCGRLRPEYSVQITKANYQELRDYIAAHPQTPVRASRQDQWLLFKPHRPFFHDSFDSFPSGHANAAFAMAAFLCVLYRPGRVLWFILAAGCALARVRYRRHFPDDILAGGAMGWLVANWVFTWRWPLSLSDWLARTFRRQRPQATAPRELAETSPAPKAKDEPRRRG